MILSDQIDKPSCPKRIKNIIREDASESHICSNDADAKTIDNDENERFFQSMAPGQKVPAKR